ncbi:hypothetical protein ACA910_015811 [Epithemia clementina (nom. ined.)]
MGLREATRIRGIRKWGHKRGESNTGGFREGDQFGDGKRRGATWDSKKRLNLGLEKATRSGTPHGTRRSDSIWDSKKRLKVGLDMGLGEVTRNSEVTGPELGANPNASAQEIPATKEKANSRSDRKVTDVK